MRKQFFVIALIIISCYESYSQIIFENGYFINESNQKIECLIKNNDWRNNPTEFEYKFSQNDTVQKATIRTVKEFGINNVSKYIRAKTNIDRSSNQIDKLSSERNPNFQEELLFLKVLIEGQVTLFLYIDGNLTRFFYKLNDSEINQLVFKRYLVNDKISTNDYYKQQLFMQLKCEGIQLNDLKKLRYDKNNLGRLIIKYHECINSTYINYEQKQKKDYFNLSIRPGINYSSLEIHNSTTGSRTDFGYNIGVRFGFETEFILPFNKNKWGIIIEPAYQHFSSEQSKETTNVSGGILMSKVDYNSIELLIGVRHYFYINDNSKLFLNISYSMDFSRNSTIEFLRQDNSQLSSLEIKKTGPNIATGIGYKLKGTYSIELRYSTSRNILEDYLYWNSDYRTISVVIGYSLF